MQERTRTILHIDLDAFYASVEQRDHPEYQGRPVIVGGSPDRRGVVATASYEARKFGVHSAMPSHTALHLCPIAIFLPARFEVYRAVSQQIMAIFHLHTSLVEPLSLDEAYLDVTATLRDLDEAVQLAREIKRQIRGTDRTHRFRRCLLLQVPGENRLRSQQTRWANGHHSTRGSGLSRNTTHREIFRGRKSHGGQAQDPGYTDGCRPQAPGRGAIA